MNNHPLISVIIPTYNSAQYLGNCIRSVYAQTYDNLEIIIIDDGSTDNTREVLNPFIGKLNYTYQTNKGVSAARNTGIEKASGEYIAFIDSDDEWEPDNLHTKIEILNSDQSLGGVFSNFCIINSEGMLTKDGIRKLYPLFSEKHKTITEIFSDQKSLCIENKKIQYYAGNIFDSLFFGNFILNSSIVFRAQFARTIGEFKRDLITQEDYEFWLRFSKIYSLAYVESPLIKYRRHETQLTHPSNNVKIIENVLNIISKYQNDFKLKNSLRVFKRRKIEITLRLAQSYINIGQMRVARKLLLQNIRQNPINFGNCFSMILSFLPNKILFLLKSLK